MSPQGSGRLSDNLWTHSIFTRTMMLYLSSAKKWYATDSGARDEQNIYASILEVGCTDLGRFHPHCVQSVKYEILEVLGA